MIRAVKDADELIEDAPPALRELGFSEGAVRAYVEAIQRGLDRKEALQMAIREEKALGSRPDPGDAVATHGGSTRKPR